jgi:hypothetical protein
MVGLLQSRPSLPRACLATSPGSGRRRGRANRQGIPNVKDCLVGVRQQHPLLLSAPILLLSRKSPTSGGCEPADVVTQCKRIFSFCPEQRSVTLVTPLVLVGVPAPRAASQDLGLVSRFFEGGAS